MNDNAVSSIDVIREELEKIDPLLAKTYIDHLVLLGSISSNSFVLDSEERKQSAKTLLRQVENMVVATHDKSKEENDKSWLELERQQKAKLREELNEDFVKLQNMLKDISMKLTKLNIRPSNPKEPHTMGLVISEKATRLHDAGENQIMIGLSMWELSALHNEGKGKI